MKRGWVYAGGAVLAVAAIAGIFSAISATNNHRDKTAVLSKSTTSQNPKSATNPACLIFTLADAKQVLGNSAKGGDSGANSSSEDLQTSTCTYTQSSGGSTQITSSKSASLLVRAPKTEAGITSNQNQFGRLKPSDIQDVAGYGEKAYWNPQFGQLNILKNNTWYIVSYGPLTPANRTLDQTKQLADILAGKL